MARAKTKAAGHPVFVVENCLLFQVSGAQSAFSEEDSEQGLFITAGISPVNMDGSDGFFTTAFRCGRAGDAENSRVAFFASYGVMITVHDGDPIEAAKAAASTVAWSRFVDLFSITNGQMRSRLPPLPIHPEAIVELPSDEAEIAVDASGLPVHKFAGKPAAISPARRPRAAKRATHTGLPSR